MSNDKEINIRGPKYDWSDDNRKLEITIKTTPAELRLYAMYLEEGKKVRINWYHSRIVFINEHTAVIPETEEQVLEHVVLQPAQDRAGESEAGL